MNDSAPNDQPMVLPQPYGKAPIFAPTVQEKTRIVNVEDSVWEIGVTDPDSREVSSKFLRGFDVRHAQVIFGLLNYYHRNGYSYDAEVDMSYNKLMDICGFSHGKQDSIVKEILADLKYTTTAIRRGNERTLFTVIGEISKKQDLEKDRTHLKYIVFSRSFIDMLDQHHQFFSFYMAFWNKLPSKIAQAIYLYLPSRAIEKTSFQNAYKIKLENLMTQLGMPVPKYKSERRKVFSQHKSPVITQLDGAPIHHNKVLRVELAETKDKTDYNLCAWTEIAKDYVEPEFNTSSNLAVWWQESGGTLREFQERMRRKPFLNDYEAQNLKNAGINVKKDMTFLRMSKALLGQCIFSEITGTMNMLEQTEQLNSPYRYLIGAVHNEIKNTAKEQGLFPEHI